MIETLPFERMFASAVEQKAFAFEKGRINTPLTVAVNSGHQQQTLVHDLNSESLIEYQEQQQQQ